MPNKRPGTRIYFQKNASLYEPYLVLHILARQFLRKATNSPNLVVNKSWYLYNLSLGRLLEGDPLECCLYFVNTSSRHWLRLCFKPLWPTICEIFHPILLFGTIRILGTQEYCIIKCVISGELFLSVDIGYAPSGLNYKIRSHLHPNFNAKEHLWKCTQNA